MTRGFINGRALGKLTGCERDLAINLPSCFHLLFSLPIIRKTKNARLKNPTYLLHKNVMKPLDDASEESRFLSALNAPESFVHKALKDEQIECIHRIICQNDGRDVLAVLLMGLGKSAIYQLISKGLYRTPCFLLAYKVERYLHQVLLLKLTHYKRNGRTCFTK